MCQHQTSYTAKMSTKSIALQFSIAGYIAPIHTKASKTLCILTTYYTVESEEIFLHLLRQRGTETPNKHRIYVATYFPLKWH